MSEQAEHDDGGPATKTVAVVGKKGAVENIVVVLVEGSDWVPPKGTKIVDIPDGQTALIRGTWDGETFIAPPEIDPPADIDG